MASAVITARNRLNPLLHRRGPDDPVTREAMRDLRVAKAERVIRELVAVAPPLTAEQRTKIAAILLSPAPEAGADRRAADEDRRNPARDPVTREAMRDLRVAKAPEAGAAA